LLKEQIFEGLVRFNSNTTDSEPALATEWTASSDGLSYEFALRNDVVFHDKTPFNAQAVATSFLRQIDEKNQFHTPDMAYAGTDFPSVKDVEPIDDYHLTIFLTQPSPRLLGSLADFPAAVLSPTSVAAF